VQPGQPLVLQLVTRYRHPDGSSRIRVLTTARTWGGSNDEVGAAGGLAPEVACA
jgi:hypothetical protein